MARSGAARADSGSSRSWLIHASSTACRRFTDVDTVSVQPLPSSSLGNRILRAETGGEFRRRAGKNGRNSVRRPGYASLTSWNCEGFYRPGNRAGLPGLDGGRCRDRTCDPSRVKVAPNIGAWLSRFVGSARYGEIPAHYVCLALIVVAVVCAVVVAIRSLGRKSYQRDNP
jgi:hypothetical protein